MTIGSAAVQRGIKSVALRLHDFLTMIDESLSLSTNHHRFIQHRNDAVMETMGLNNTIRFQQL